MTTTRLRRARAVEYLAERHGIIRTVATLAKYACVGGGPRYLLDGRFPLYDTADLDDWAEAVLRPPVSDAPPRGLQHVSHPIARLFGADPLSLREDIGGQN